MFNETVNYTKWWSWSIGTDIFISAVFIWSALYGSIPVLTTTLVVLIWILSIANIISVTSYLRNGVDDNEGLKLLVTRFKQYSGSMIHYIMLGSIIVGSIIIGSGWWFTGALYILGHLVLGDMAVRVLKEKSNDATV